MTNLLDVPVGDATRCSQMRQPRRTNITCYVSELTNSPEQYGPGQRTCCCEGRRVSNPFIERPILRASLSFCKTQT